MLVPYDSSDDSSPTRSHPIALIAATIAAAWYTSGLTMREKNGNSAVSLNASEVEPYASMGTLLSSDIRADRAVRLE
jgi:hypothetical protein